MTATLRVIAETLNLKLKTVRRVATRRRFHTEKIDGVLYADPEEVKRHFTTSKPGRPVKAPGISDELVEALLWQKDKDGNDWPTRPCICTYAEGKLSDEDFDRFMAFCDREPALADTIMESIDEGQIWVPEPENPYLTVDKTIAVCDNEPCLIEQHKRDKNG